MLYGEGRSGGRVFAKLLGILLLGGGGGVV